MKYEFKDNAHRLMYVREAGEVKRFHTNAATARPQTVGQHTYNMLAMFPVMYPDVCAECGKKVMQAIIGHDLEERILGDIPKPSKISFIDREKLDEFNETFLTDLFGSDAFSELGEGKQNLVKALDMLDLFLYCLEEKRFGNNSSQINSILDNIIRYAENNRDCIEDRIYGIIMQKQYFEWHVPELEHDCDMSRER